MATSSTTGPLVDFVSFKNLEPSDELVIQTFNSAYQFSVLDPANRRGMLRGGSLGGASEAVLVGSVPSPKETRTNCKGINAHDHALFILLLHNGMKRMITSEIVGLKVRRNR